MTAAVATYLGSLGGAATKRMGTLCYRAEALGQTFSLERFSARQQTVPTHFVATLAKESKQLVTLPVTSVFANLIFKL